MKPVMYSFLNKGLGMSTPKAGAQLQHAAVEAFQASDPKLLEEWYKGGHYTKIILEARDEIHLRNIQEYLRARGFGCVPIIDEGRTEVPPHSFTAIGVPVVDKDDPHTAATFGDFKVYKDEPVRPDPTKTKRRKIHIRIPGF